MSSMPCRILLICRRSTRLKQALSLDPTSQLLEQELLLRDWLSRNLKEAASVLVLFRFEPETPENSILEQIQRELDQGCSLVVVQSLDRIARGFELFEFLELAERQEVRVVSVSDSFDSSESDWSAAWALISCRYGFGHYATQQRIRRARRKRAKEQRGNQPPSV